MDAMSIPGFHLAVLLLLHSEGRENLIEKIPRIYTEEEFSRIYNRFCQAFKELMPDCPDSGYFGIYVVKGGRNIPTTEDKFNEPWIQQRNRLKNIIFGFSKDYSGFWYNFKNLASDDYDGYYSRLADKNEWIGPEPPQRDDRIFFTPCCFYRLCNYEGFISLQNAPFTEAFKKAAVLALEL
jgi:hypothetical protein